MVCGRGSLPSTRPLLPVPAETHAEECLSRFCCSLSEGISQVQFRTNTSGLSAARGLPGDFCAWASHLAKSTLHTSCGLGLVGAGCPWNVCAPRPAGDQQPDGAHRPSGRASACWQVLWELLTGTGQIRRSVLCLEINLKPPVTPHPLAGGPEARVALPWPPLPHYADQAHGVEPAVLPTRCHV